MICKCGTCGEDAGVYADSRRGHKKGDEREFLPGHNKVFAAMTSQPGLTLDLPKIDALALRGMTDEAAAIQGDKWARFMDEVQKLTFAHAGMIAHIFDSRNLWTLVPKPDGSHYQSYTEWGKSAMPCSWSKVCDAKKCVDILMASKVPADKIAEMERDNMRTMARGILSESVRREPEVIEAAIHSNGHDFRQKLIDEHPEQGIEQEKWITLKLSDSQRDRAVEIMEKFGFQSWPEAIEICFEEYDQTHVRAS